MYTSEFRRTLKSVVIPTLSVQSQLVTFEASADPELVARATDHGVPDNDSRLLTEARCAMIESLHGRHRNPRSSFPTPPALNGSKAAPQRVLRVRPRDSYTLRSRAQLDSTMGTLS